MSRASLVLMLFAVLPAVSTAQTSAPAPAPAPPAEWPPLKVVDVRWIDTTVAACTDFSQFANGAWLAHDTIPAAYASSGVTRDMSDRNELVVRSVLDDAATHRSSFPPDSTPRKLGTFYATCMDSTAIEAAGATPIRPWLRGIDSVTTRPRLVPEIAKLQVLGVNVVFRYSPDVDPRDRAPRAGAEGQRRRAGLREARGLAVAGRAARHLARVSQVSCDRVGRAVAEYAVRAGRFRVPVQIQRRAGAPAPLEALPPRGRRRCRRGAGPGVRREDVPARGARPGPRGDRRYPHGISRTAAPSH